VDQGLFLRKFPFLFPRNTSSEMEASTADSIVASREALTLYQREECERWIKWFEDEALSVSEEDATVLCRVMDFSHNLLLAFPIDERMQQHLRHQAIKGWQVLLPWFYVKYWRWMSGCFITYHVTTSGRNKCNLLVKIIITDYDLLLLILREDVAVCRCWGCQIPSLLIDHQHNDNTTDNNALTQMILNLEGLHRL